MDAPLGNSWLQFEELAPQAVGMTDAPAMDTRYSFLRGRSLLSSSPFAVSRGRKARRRRRTHESNSLVSSAPESSPPHLLNRLRPRWGPKS